MSLNVNVGGIWKDISSAHVKVGGSWRPIANLWTKVSGTWKLVYSNLTASLTNSVESGSNIITSFPDPAIANCTFTLQVSGTGPFTYLWHVTGAYSYTSVLTGSTLIISLDDNTAQEQSGTAWCDVTDAYGQIVTTDIGTWTLTLVEP